MGARLHIYGEGHEEDDLDGDNTDDHALSIPMAIALAIPRAKQVDDHALSIPTALQEAD